MLILLPSIPSLNFFDWANTYLDLNTIVSFPTIQTYSLGVGQSCPSSCHRCLHQGCSRGSWGTGSGQQPGMVLREWKDRKAWVDSLSIKTKCWDLDLETWPSPASSFRP